MSKYDVNCENSLTELNKLLSTQLFIGGNFPNAQDAFTFELFASNAPCVKKYPSLTAWFYLVNPYMPHIKESWKVEECKKGGKSETKCEKKCDKKDQKESKPVEVKAEKVVDENNMFEDDEEEDPNEAKARQERMKAALEAKKAKDAKKGGKAKEEVIAKSLILLNIKVWEQEQNLDDLAKKVLDIKMDGLDWKTEYKTPVIAFGMKMLTTGLVIEDEKVSIEDIIDILQGWEEEVQSVDIESFGKI